MKSTGDRNFRMSDDADEQKKVEQSNLTLLSYEINKDGKGKEDAMMQLKPYVDTESKLVSIFH